MRLAETLIQVVFLLQIFQSPEQTYVPLVSLVLHIHYLSVEYLQHRFLEAVLRIEQAYLQVFILGPDKFSVFKAHELVVA